MSEDFQDLGHITLHSPFREGSKDVEDGIKILQLTDLHLFPSHTREWTNGKGKLVHFGDKVYADGFQILTDLVQSARPDLVVLTGDVLDGRGPWMNSTSFIDEFESIADAICGVQWAFVPGNHDDDQSPWARSDLLKVFAVKNCVQSGAKGFDHTFTVSLQGDESYHQPPSTLQTRLFLFDSGGNHPDKTIRYHTVNKRSVEGLRKFSDRAATHREVALIYLHIPLPQYQNIDPVIGRAGLFEAALQAGMVPSPWKFVPALVRALGKHRVVGCSNGEDPGLFDALAAEIRVHGAEGAVFCGHDHHSDAVFLRPPLFLAYGRCSSLSPPRSWEGAAPNPLPAGARLVTVRPSDLHAPLSTSVLTPAGVDPSSRLDLKGRAVERRMKLREWVRRGGAALVALLLAVAAPLLRAMG